MASIPMNRFRRLCCVILLTVVMFTAINTFQAVFQSSRLSPSYLNMQLIEKHASYKFITREEDGSVNVVLHVPKTAPIAMFLRERSLEGISILNPLSMEVNTTFREGLTTIQHITTKEKADTSQEESITYPLTASGSPYVLNNEKICTGVHNITFIIMVHTATDNFYRRSVVRETWANKDLLRNYSMRVLFLLGRPQDKKVQTAIEHESSLHKDIVQGNFLDTYHNLTHKGVLGYRWISEFCPQVKFVLKVDDDVFVNVFKLLSDMSNSYKADKRTIRCYFRENGTSPIMRKNSKWKVNDWEFRNMTHFPVSYCNGFFVILTSDIIKEMYQSSRKTPFFWIDDVYLFGLLPAKVGSVTFKSVPGLNLNEKQALECFTKDQPCDYLAATAVNKGNMETLWYGAIHQYKNLVEAFAKPELLS
ncbi:hypothetical protein CHS0354_002940 [Potamilus streckersoni]|uniref:Hexosyltransferase n=1 Tax=Potamilus streckersoni TaxID=2493646 RepID=A0AAE0VHE3_9BIVA|nr:hypothetical protein CHS0354_002940 [Potamilus streckersoni]